MANISYLKKYLRYKLTAQHKGGHGVHSPFVFALITQLIETQQPYYAFARIATIRKQFGANRLPLTVTDLGAGSATMRSPQRRIADIAQHSAVRPRYGELLFKLVNRFRPEYILELGTSLGISTLYLALARKGATLHTIEGCPQTANVAHAMLREERLTNLHCHTGNFDTVLPKVLTQIPQIDFAFVDGNHRQQPTISYFEQCVKLAHNDTVLVFDDIHCSAEMEQAWLHIQHHPRVTLTIDLFFMGLVFFRTESKAKQHYTLNF